jgi:hypothetical protein
VKAPLAMLFGNLKKMESIFSYAVQINCLPEMTAIEHDTFLIKAIVKENDVAGIHNKHYKPIINVRFPYC